MKRIDPSSFPLLKGIWVEPRSKEGPPTFPLHDILEGEVLDRIDDRQIMIRLEGRSYLAESRIPLLKGDRILLRVEARDPRVILTPLAAGEEPVPGSPFPLKTFSGLFGPETQTVSLSGLQRLLNPGVPREIRESFEKLIDLLARFSVEDPSRLDSGEITKCVDRSGLLFERKIGRMIESGIGSPWEKMVEGDLKGLLITLREKRVEGHPSYRLPEKMRHALDETGDALNRILDKIEAAQVLNLLPVEDRQRIFLLLPLWFREQLHFADVQISLPRGRGDASEPEEFTVLFLLDMPDWGRLSLEATLKGKKFYGLFKVSDPAVASFLQENLPGLQERLNEMGFAPQLNVSAEAPEKSSQHILSEMEGIDSLLNVVI
jgi:hypothetical protein